MKIKIEAYSGNNRLLDLIHQQTADTIRKANQKLSSFPIKLKYKFQGGFPSETEEEFLTILHMPEHILMYRGLEPKPDEKAWLGKFQRLSVAEKAELLNILCQSRHKMLLIK